MGEQTNGAFKPTFWLMERLVVRPRVAQSLC